MKLICAFLIYSFMIFSARSETLIKDWSSCGEVSSNSARLTCYDSIANSTIASEEDATKSGTAVLGKWKVEQNKNPIDDTSTAVATLFAENGISNPGRPIALIARCQSGKTEVYIAWNDYLGTDGDNNGDYKIVTSRMGSALALPSKWATSSDKTATFATDPFMFLKILLKSEKFVAQITPFNASTITAEFDTSGLIDAIQPITKACNWDLKPF